MRHYFVMSAIAVSILIAGLAQLYPPAWHAFWIAGPLIILGLHDMLQSRHAVLRNFPVLGWGRYLLELIRPEINQYFIESNTDGTPFDREQRSIVYQRAKKQLDTLPFGTQHDVYGIGYEWINHSMAAHSIKEEDKDPRILIGESTCKLPYLASVLNIGAMSYGSLSQNAIKALNQGAAKGRFAHNTGEGSISPYHREGGDLIWQLGTGYFGACSEAGVFNLEKFSKNAALSEVKMIELKISQGAKPGHGGILPAAKVTPQIAEIRGVPLGRDVLSPPNHSAFSTPVELCQFIQTLREASGGKPVGIKLCVGKRREFLAFCKAMRETGIHPDYIAVDGGEGGTGAAPFEFSNFIGCPLTEGLIFVNNSLTGIGLRNQIRVLASGKIITGFDLARVLAIGADAAYSARGMMLALGCIQARRCNTNHCPVGVATQHPGLIKGLVVTDKATRVFNYHEETVESLMEILAAADISHPKLLHPRHIQRRMDATEIKHYGELYEYLEPGALLSEPIPQSFKKAWQSCSAHTFSSLP